MKNIMLAGSDQEKLASWKCGLNGMVSTLLVTDKLVSNKLSALSDEILRIKPQILLLDFDLLGLDGSFSIVNLKKLCAETRIIVMSGDISDDTEWELMKAGMRGCCRHTVKHELLNQIVAAVYKGELWMSRALTSRLIDELGNIPVLKINANRTAHGVFGKLTQRESDIADRVGKGECNKQIALACGITERTVKAHLTEIFHKIGVSDRLNLALVLSANDRVGMHPSVASLNSSIVNAMPPKLTRVLKSSGNRRISA